MGGGGGGGGRVSPPPPPPHSEQKFQNIFFLVIGTFLVEMAKASKSIVCASKLPTVWKKKKNLM